MAKPLFDTESVAQGNLLDQSPIVPDAIVTKTLIDTGQLKQILFAMDAGQEISDHRAPFPASVQVLEGEMVFLVAGAERTMRPHDWLIMPADEPHAVSATQPVRFLLTLIKGTG